MLEMANQHPSNNRMARGSRRTAFWSALSSVRWVVGLTLLSLFSSSAAESHDRDFWKHIRETKFAPPPNESVDKLALELVDLAAATDPVLRDECGYEIFATWIYRDQRLTGEQLEQLRQKLLPSLSFHIGQTGDDSVFRRSFSALYLSVLAAQELKKPFFSDAAFKSTLEAALHCYSREQDLRGYVSEKGWAHATAHVADLLKFLARNPKLSTEDQKQIVATVAQRCRTAPSVFVWGEDARMAAALLSIVNRKDLQSTGFTEWFGQLGLENENLSKSEKLDSAAYVRVRNQANVLVHLAVDMDLQENSEMSKSFRQQLNTVLAKLR